MNIESTSSDLTLRDRLDHLVARLAVRRMRHRIAPGLYSLGKPDKKSPVFVTANYTLSFDALRASLKGIDGYILVLDTKGINVWCAAGKGTFGTDELVFRIEQTKLKDIVDHRKLILPQLGATGVAAYLVHERSGFRIEYGPIRASDLPEYLRKKKAAPEMRKVRFDLGDRFILTGVEFAQILLPMVILGILMYLAGGIIFAAGIVAAVFTGRVLFPLLLPWIPTPNFSTKGFVLGIVAAFPFVVFNFLGQGDLTLVMRLGWAGVLLTGMPAITAFMALNFTGSTVFTSKSGVKREIFRYFPLMVGMAAASLLGLAVLNALKLVV
jgi:hypothetical protein